MTTIAITVLGWVLPILLAPLVYFVARELLNVNLAIDNLPPIVKRLAVVALGTLIVAALSAAGVIVPTECVGLPNEFTAECAKALNAPVIVKGVTAALAAFVIHAIKKQKPND